MANSFDTFDDDERPGDRVRSTEQLLRKKDGVYDPVLKRGSDLLASSADIFEQPKVRFNSRALIGFAFAAFIAAEVVLPTGAKPSNAYAAWYIRMHEGPLHVERVRAEIEEDKAVNIARQQACVQRRQQLAASRNEWNGTCGFLGNFGFGGICQRGVDSYFEPALDSSCA